jgi:hypothetical protein
MCRRRRDCRPSFSRKGRDVNDRIAASSAEPADGRNSLPDAAPPSAVIAQVFGRLNLRQRAGVLGRLLAPVGPLALAVIGGGAFAKHVAQARWTEIQVSLEDAATATTSQVHDLVRYVQQSNPEVISQLLNTLAADPTMIAAVGASIAALTIRQRSHPGRKNQAP